MAAVRDNAWVGIDVGKTHHWVCAVDADGKTLLSVKVANDEAGIVGLIAAVTALTQQLTWAVDIIGAPSALLLALLAQAGQPVRYASGRVVAAMSAAYVGEGKTDAKDARVIAQPRSDPSHRSNTPGRRLRTRHMRGFTDVAARAIASPISKVSRGRLRRGELLGNFAQAPSHIGLVIPRGDLRSRTACLCKT